MKTLLILRHAKSSWADGGLSDHDRPLNERGRRDAPRMGKLIRDEGLTPDLIISSTAKRARKTAVKVAKACGYDKNSIRLADELYLAAPAAYVAVLQELPESLQRVMVVGHNPGLQELVGRLTGAEQSLPTAALVLLSIDIDSWSEFSLNTTCLLVNLWLPRELD